MVPCFCTIESPTLSAVSPLDSFPPLATRYCVLSLLMASRSLFDMEMRASVAALSLALVALQDIVSQACVVGGEGDEELGTKQRILWYTHFHAVVWLGDKTRVYFNTRERR